jgi:hypothetical protein
MKATLIHSPAFASEWRRFRLSDDDLRHLELAIMQDPEGGAMMGGTGGVRKMRFAPPSMRTGKSGAFRVCYVWFAEFGAVLLLLIYPKNEKDSLSADDKAACRSLVQRFREHLGR